MLFFRLKLKKVNGTFEPLNPLSLLESIKYFQSKNYQIVFAGRELPRNFFK